MNFTESQGRHWRFPRLLLTDYLLFTLMVWAGFVIVVACVAAGIASFGEITSSVWEQAAGAAYWYVAFIGGHLLYTTLPMRIAHGQTRRHFAIEAAIYWIVFTAAVAALIAVTFFFEAGLYGLAEWPPVLSDRHLFTSHVDVALIFLEYWLTLLVWTAVGGFIGSMLYRFDANGWLAFIPGLLIIILGRVYIGSSFGPINQLIGRLGITPNTAPTIAPAIIVAAGCCLVALAMTWTVIRDVPMRNR